ncbi:serine/threonine-protein phosphatase [Piscinibacter sp. Jin2]|uniref:Serine/threonine-protein phosphatase n=1 Tax=Aquariibacter lacus TaxID=2801332 RepID=A0A9X1BMN2_9BURK|nr:serine/threonine-protein phosphatase [Piscinibacter lacus]
MSQPASLPPEPLVAEPLPEDGQALELELAILSRAGGRDYNEDACGHWHSDTQLCCVVADGAGGHGGGDVASRLAVSYLIDQCADAPLQSPEDLRELLLDTNAKVIRHRADAPGQREMHTTVVALFIDRVRGQALWGHAGDSRLYLFRDGAVARRTRDHSLVQSMVEAGLLRPEDTRNHPQRSQLHSALGTAPEDLRIGTCEAPLALRPGDVFLLCTDGLWEFVDDAVMLHELAAAPDPAAWLAALEACVLAEAEAGGKTRHDNFSGIALWVTAPAQA